MYTNLSQFCCREIEQASDSRGKCVSYVHKYTRVSGPTQNWFIDGFL
jgi:hypothetical protein